MRGRQQHGCAFNIQILYPVQQLPVPPQLLRLISPVYYLLYWILSKYNAPFVLFYPTEYKEEMENSLQTSLQGSACTDAIRQGTATLQSMAQSSSTACNNITNLFNLCYPLDCSDSNQVSYVFQGLSNNFARNIQYNNNPYWSGPNIVTYYFIVIKHFRL